MSTPTSHDLEALHARLAELEAQVAAQTARSVPAPPPEPYQAPPPVRRTTVALAALRGSDGLPRDFRALRQLAAAVALGRGDPLPGSAAVRLDYVPDMAALYALRVRGLSWRAALSEAPGLDAPSQGEIEHEARVLRGQLRLLWDGILPIVGMLDKRLPGADAT